MRPYIKRLHYIGFCCKQINFVIATMLLQSYRYIGAVLGGYDDEVSCISAGNSEQRMLCLCAEILNSRIAGVFPRLMDLFGIDGTFLYRVYFRDQEILSIEIIKFPKPKDYC